MGEKTKTRLTPTARLTRGVTYTLLGPVDITWGTLGLGFGGARAAVKGLRRREVQLANGQTAAVAHELAAVRQVAQAIPVAYAEARKPKHHMRGWLIATFGVVVLAAGAFAFTIARRSMQPDPSPRPPSVQAEPRP